MWRKTRHSRPPEGICLWDFHISPGQWNDLTITQIRSILTTSANSLQEVVCCSGTTNTTPQLKDPQHGHVRGHTVPRPRRGKTQCASRLLRRGESKALAMESYSTARWCLGTNAASLRSSSSHTFRVCPQSNRFPSICLLTYVDTVVQKITGWEKELSDLPSVEQA